MGESQAKASEVETSSTAARAAGAGLQVGRAGAPVPPHFIKLETGGLAFIHLCCVCGSEYAPFGDEVSLGRAIDTKNAALAGQWYCREHKP